MDELGLFTAALGLSGPWQVVRSEFDAEATQLDLYLDFERGAQFACPAKDCAQDHCPVHDTVDTTWRHLDFSSIGRCCTPGYRECAAPSMGYGRSVCPGPARARGSRCCSRHWCCPSRR